MNKINLLSQDTYNKIAAGEVVERPASAIKELIENSIDAGAKNITITVEDAGEGLMIVTDDGEGIYKDDLKTAFMPHATSKIKEIDDIYNITTLGFRGEALPSIASISKLKIKSRTNDSIEGKELILEGGNVIDFKDVGCSVGTTIEVNNLFYNVPVRQKFLKSTRRENAIISDMILRIALSHSHISFKYINNGKEMFVTSGSGNLLETIRTLYGKKVYENVNFFEGHGDIASVHGYIGNAEISRGSRNRQSIFVNNRLIKSPMITKAIENAFKSFLTINKFPFFVLFLDIYPDFIDINVHPSKAEIKFNNESFIFKLVFDSVHHALKEAVEESFNVNIEEDSYDPIYIKDKTEKETLEIIQPSLNFNEDTKQLMEKENLFIKEDKISIDKDYSYNIKSFNSNNKIDDKSILNSISLQKPSNAILKSYIEPNKELNTIPMNIKKAKFPKLKIIGQFNNSYILAEAFEELYMVDQHAAHEKILFEKYTKEIKEKKVVSQVLAIPQIEELSPNDYAIYYENKETFTLAGFNIEPFGENTISICEVPLFLGETNLLNLFNDILLDLKNLGEGDTTKVRYLKIATLACKAAVKANHHLTIEEMEHLLEELRFIEEPFTCPHGRPTIIKYSLKDIEKRFKRIQ